MESGETGSAGAPTDGIGSDHRDLLRSFLGDRDIKCPGCGYNLRGLEATTCPECGDSIALTVTGRRARVPGHVEGLIGLGLSALVLGTFSLSRLGFDPIVGLAGIVGTALLVRAFMRWHRDRGKLVALTRRQRYERLALCWAIPVVILLTKMSF
ncbi:MAG: hypothetical protein ACYTGP_01500 [Planctomycetota bacterium]|jgi:hypothetical protein